MFKTRPDVPLIGRRRHLDTVHAWLADLIRRQGRAALIEGEPGIGKSSLARVAASEARNAGCLALWASCDPLSEAFPLLPLIDALCTHGASPDRDPSSIADVLRVDVSRANRVDVVAPAVERFLTLIENLTETQRVLLVVDDLQWADAATVLTLGRLARSVKHLPLLVIATTRPLPRREDLLALRRMIQPADLMRLHNLTDHEAAQLIAEKIGGSPGPGLLRMAGDAAGNPLYLTELVDALARGGQLDQDQGIVDTAHAGQPSSLSAAIADRLGFLPGPTRDLLRSAALLGVDFSVSELAVVSGRRVSDLLTLLDDAIVGGVLLENGAELAFRHAMIRAALYDGMPTAVRAAWHRDAARALAEHGSSVERIARQLLPTVQVHETTGSADDWIVEWLANTSQQLVGQAPQVAVPLLRWATERVPPTRTPRDVLACRLADALFRVDEPQEAERVATTALAEVARPELLVDLYWTLAQCQGVEGQSERALADLQCALTLPGIGARDRARLQVMIARAYRSVGRVDLAGEVARAALDEATAIDDRWAIGWALSILTIVHGMRGEAEKALPLFERALAVSEGDPALADLRLLLQINHAVALSDLGRYEEAINAARQVCQRADRAGNVIRTVQARGTLGELLFEVGKWTDALTELDLSSGQTSNPSVECSTHGLAAVIQFHRGDAAAHAHLASSQQAGTLLGGRMIGPLILARSLEREHADLPTEALVVLVDGVPDSAEAAEQAIELFGDIVRLAMATGDRRTARKVLERAEAAARDTTVPHGQAVALHCRGLYEQDAETLVRAAKEYAAAGRPLPEAQALEAAAVALADAKDAVGARERFTEAFARYSELGAHWDLARIQATFRRYGIRRGPHTRHRRADRGWNSLTPTEVKIVELVAQGLSNPSIAAELFLSRRTVQTHVSHVLAKLDLRSRTDIAREASRRDLAGQVGDADSSAGPSVGPAGDGITGHPGGQRLLR